MKKFFVVIAVFALLISVSSQASASWSQGFDTDDNPNLLNLWSDEEFESIVSPSDWTSWLSSDNLWGQAWTEAYDYGVKNISFTATWLGDKTTPLHLAAQEIHYDFSTGSAVDTYNYGLYWSGSAWDGGLTTGSPDYAGYFEAAGGQYDPVNPVPEPASLLLLGTGLFGLFGVSRKKKRA